MDIHRAVEHLVFAVPDFIHQLLTRFLPPFGPGQNDEELEFHRSEHQHFLAERGRPGFHLDFQIPHTNFRDRLRPCVLVLLGGEDTLDPATLARAAGSGLALCRVAGSIDPGLSARIRALLPARGVDVGASGGATRSVWAAPAKRTDDALDAAVAYLKKRDGVDKV